MKRNKMIEGFNQPQQVEQKQRIAFHEAGHAMAIHLNNKARNLPPVYFQIMFKGIYLEPEKGLNEFQMRIEDYIAQVEGGRLVEYLPTSIDALVHKTSNHHDTMDHFLKDYMVAFEADIINLLIGPLAEAKHIHNTDGEVFNYHLVNVDALKNYGGDSDFALVNDYLQSFSTCKKQQTNKLVELFDQAFNFVNNPVNWAAITKLAHYILNNNKLIIDYEEVASLVEF